MAGILQKISENWLNYGSDWDDPWPSPERIPLNYPDLNIQAESDSLFVYISNYWGVNTGPTTQGGGDVMIAYWHFKKSSVNSLGLSEATAAKCRQIFGLSDNEYVSCARDFQSRGNIQCLQYKSTNLSGVHFPLEIVSSTLEVDDTLPLIIDTYTANWLTNYNIAGETVDPIEALTPYRGGLKDIADWKFGDTFMGGTALFPNILLFETVGQTDAECRHLLEELIADCEDYEDLSSKFYQNPPTSKIFYTVDCNCNNGKATLSISMDRAWKGINEYPEQAVTNVYTEYQGVKLDRQTVGTVGSGTSYEVIAQSVNSSGGVVTETTYHIDGPSYPFSLDLNALNLKGMSGGVNGHYRVKLFINSYKTEFSLTLSGNHLIQNRSQVPNGSTQSEGSIYFGFDYPLKDTSVETPDVKTSNSGIRFREKLTVTYTNDKKKPLVTIPDSPLPDLTGFAKVFKLAAVDVVDFAAWLWGTDLLDPDSVFNLETYKRINQNPMDNIMFLKVSPFDLESGANYPITIGNITYGDRDYPKMKTYTKTTIGNIQLTRYYGDYRDFPPFTRYRLFLPFIGFVDLDAHLLYDAPATLTACVNSDTFETMFEIRRTADNMIIGQWECNTALDFPLTSSNLAEMVGGFSGNFFKTVASAATGNYKETIKNADDTLDSAINTVIGGITIQNNAPSSNAALGASRWAYLEISRVVYNEPENYGHTQGYPCNKTLTLGNCMGYTVVKNADISGITATESERNLIMDALASGIYL